MLYSTLADCTGVTWVGEAPAAEGVLFRCTCKYRYRQADQPVEAVWQGDTMRLRSLVPQRAVTPGQSAVLYDGPRCLGGAVVDRILDAGVQY